MICARKSGSDVPGEYNLKIKQLFSGMDRILLFRGY